MVVVHIFRKKKALRTRNERENLHFREEVLREGLRSFYVETTFLPEVKLMKSFSNWLAQSFNSSISLVIV